MNLKFKNVKGFTIIELLVSVAIFAFMTALLLAKYGSFNQGTLLTNLAYDVALTIRNAQSYGLNVKSSERLSNNFDNPYGVHFVATTTSFVFFADQTADGVFNQATSDAVMASTTIKRGSYVGSLCAGSETNCIKVDTLDITFKRPDPNAIIKAFGVSNPTYARISLMASDGSRRDVTVRSIGQISVPN